MAEITRTDIYTGIIKLNKVGKKLPYTDRIRTAEEKDKSLSELMDELVQIWWDLLLPMHISQSRWERAVNKACFSTGPNSTVIQPSLITEALKEVEREDAESQQRAYREEKRTEEPRISDSQREDVAAAIAWTKPTMLERRAYIKRGGNAIMDFMRPIPEVIADARKMFGVSEQEARAQINILRCWHNDQCYAKRFGVKAKSRIVFDGNKLRLEMI